MRIFLASLVFGFGLSAAAFAADMSGLVGSYTMTWKNGKSGTYTITAINDSAATVTYAYGNKSQTKNLKVKGGQIRGGGWFPTLKVSGNGSVSATHSGSSARVSRN